MSHSSSLSLPQLAPPPRPCRRRRRARRVNVTAHAAPWRPYTGEGEQGPVASSANHFGVLRGFVSAYSQNDVAGTMHRLAGPSHRRQCGLPTLRMLVIGAPPNCGGPGIPQRAIASSRSPSAPTRMIGAIWSGKIAGNSGSLPVRSCGARNQSRIAAWPLVKEYRLQIGRTHTAPTARRPQGRR